MAFDVFSAFRKYPVRFTALAVVGFFLTATSTQAGFEWVPAAKTAPAPAEASPPPAVPASPVEEAPMAQPPADELLLPEDQTLSPIPGGDAPAAENVLALPPEAQPVIRTKTFAQDAPADLPVPDMGSPQDAAAAQAALDTKQEVMVPVTTHVVLPDDAPDSARENLPKDSVEIKPYVVPQDLATPPSTDITTVTPIEAEVMAPAETATPEALPVEAAPAAQAAPSYATVEGFGSDMPLALALRDIVPDGYAYSFGRNVNPAAIVSWSGSKAWPEIISEMIAPLGLRAELNGNVVVIRSNTQGAAVPQPEAAPAVEPASGDKNTQSKTPEEFSADVYSIRRQIISDPGTKPAKQPEETLDMIKELGLSENTDGPQPLLPPEETTDAQKMEQGEKLALAEPSAGTPEVSTTTTVTPLAEASSTDIPEIRVSANDVPEDAQASAQIHTLWEAQKGDSLKRTLDDWSKKANFELVWESSHDYTIDSDILVTGDFQRAVKAVFSQGIESKQAPLMTFVAQDSKDQPSKIIIQDGTSG